MFSAARLVGLMAIVALLSVPVAHAVCVTCGPPVEPPDPIDPPEIIPTCSSEFCSCFNQTSACLEPGTGARMACADWDPCELSCEEACGDCQGAYLDFVCHPDGPHSQTACRDWVGCDQSGGDPACSTELCGTNCLAPRMDQDCTDEGQASNCKAYSSCQDSVDSTYCQDLHSHLGNSRDQLTTLDPFEEIDRAMGHDSYSEGSGEHQRHRSYLQNWLNTVGSHCENPVHVSNFCRATGNGCSYNSEKVTNQREGEWSTVVLAVHQTSSSGQNTGLSNIGGVNRVLASLGSNDVIFIDGARGFLGDRGILSMNTSPVVEAAGFEAPLNFQGSDLTIIGGNFSRSMPGPTREAIERFLGSLQSHGKTLDLHFPMDAIYENIHGFSLQQMYENVPSELFGGYIVNIVMTDYLEPLVLPNPPPNMKVTLQIGEDVSVLVAPGSGIVDAEINFLLEPAADDPCSGRWLAESTLGNLPNLSTGEAPTALVSQADWCAIEWPGHALFSYPLHACTFDIQKPCLWEPGLPGMEAEVCRHSADQGGYLWAFWPTGRGVCPSRASVYDVRNTTYEGQGIVEIYELIRE